jgi:hypothetical protein
MDARATRNTSATMKEESQEELAAHSRCREGRRMINAPINKSEMTE